MHWITTHYLDNLGTRRPTIINTDHIARVRKTPEGKAMVAWAVAGREMLKLDEDYDVFVSRIEM